MKFDHSAPDTRALFEVALYELLLQEPYAGITVASLVRRTGLSRRTFYLHFSGKEACLEALLDRCVSDLMLKIANAPDLSYAHESALQVWKDNQAFFLAIGMNGLQGLLQYRLTLYMMAEEREIIRIICHPHEEGDDDILQFYLGGSLAMYMAWVFRGCDTPVKELAQKARRLTHKPLIPLDQKE